MTHWVTGTQNALRGLNLILKQLLFFYRIIIYFVLLIFLNTIPNFLNLFTKFSLIN